MEQLLYLSLSVYGTLKQKKNSKTLPNISSMSTSKAHVTLGLNEKGEIQPHAAYAAQEIVLSRSQPHAQT